MSPRCCQLVNKRPAANSTFVMVVWRLRLGGVAAAVGRCAFEVHMTWKASGKPRSSKRKVSALPVRAMAAGRPHGPGATGAKRSRTGEEIKNGQRDQERAKHKNRSLYVSYFPGTLKRMCRHQCWRRGSNHRRPGMNHQPPGTRLRRGDDTHRKMLASDGCRFLAHHVHLCPTKIHKKRCMILSNTDGRG